jgi:hypothetical protein
VREKYCWLVVGGWFVLREKYCWLVADKPNEQAVNQMCSVFVQGSVCRIFLTFVKKVAATVTSEKHSGFL